MTVRKIPRPVQPLETVEGQIGEYGIAAKLRALRLRRKLGLVELAAHTGLSPALMSKLERGRLIPTLPTLQRIAMVYGVDLEYFFSGRRARPALSIVRAADRRRFPDVAGSRDPAYHFESLTFDTPEPACEAYVAYFERPARPKPHEHDHVEMLYVTIGTLALTIGEREYTLAAGDSVYFDARVPHAYRRATAAECQALVFTVPQPAERGGR